MKLCSAIENYFKEEYSCQCKYFNVIQKGTFPGALKSYIELSWYSIFLLFIAFLGIIFNFFLVPSWLVSI